MFFRVLELPFVLILLLISFAASEDPGFVYNNFKDASGLSFDGMAETTPSGLLRLTNHTKQQKGHALYFNPFQFRNPSSNGNTTNSNTTAVYSFSTTFVFSIVPKTGESLSGHGIAFFIAPPSGLLGAFPSQFLGLFNDTSNGDSANHVVAVELDTIYNAEFNDINDNHIGIDINGLRSIKSAPAMYVSKDGSGKRDLSLRSGEPMQVWVDYDGVKKQFDVTLAPIKVPKPNVPLLTLFLDLSPILLDSNYVGFSSATGSSLTSHYILGWSFKINGQAPPLDPSQLPKSPPTRPRKKPKTLTIGLPIIVVILGLLMIFGFVHIIIRKRKFSDAKIEDWEHNYLSHRYKYKHLYIATKGFRKEEVIGVGGFGKVYKGVLPTSKIEVAIKRVSPDSKQGMAEFIAEIVSVGQFWHKNVVRLLGYCRHNGELLLVYDLMSGGSLEKFLFGTLNPPIVLDWNQRFKIVKGIASGLLYLHEECEKVVIHRDIKASNVLLDGQMEAKLSDFGLARLHDRGTDGQTTLVAGTLGYIAPEATRTRKATTSTDVFAFGAFLLEVVCGRRPLEPRKNETEEDFCLFDWVLSSWKNGAILETRDPKLGSEYNMEEMELVLKLGLLCSHIVPESRPRMKQVFLYLEGDALFPESELWTLNMIVGLSRNVGHARGESLLEDLNMSYSSTV